MCRPEACYRPRLTHDVAVPPEEALKTAQILALKHILAQARDTSSRPLQELIAEARKALDELEPGAG